MKKQDGYVLDTFYPGFFYKEMQPLWLNTVVKFLGAKTPKLNETFAYLELACASGTNLLVCAMNYPNAVFVGIDFNMEHIEKAQVSAKQLGLKNIEFIHCDFTQFLTENTRKFDFIVNHGTYSWVSSIHQEHILKIVNNALNDSGIFYLHYMCYPGSSDLLPVQKLLNLVDQHSRVSSIESIELGKRLFTDLNSAGVFVNNNKIEALVKTLDQSNAYLAHEFLTDYWQPLYSTDVHKKAFDEAGLSYLGSANPCENMEGISIPEKMQNIIKNMPVPALKEYLKDLARDAKQRVDIFQKKPKGLTGDEHFKILNDIRFKLLPNSPQKGGITFKTPIGDIKAPKEVMSPLLEMLVMQERNFSELMTLPNFKNNPIFLSETIFLLMNAGYLHPISENKNDLDFKLKQQFTDLMAHENLNLTIVCECATAIS